MNHDLTEPHSQIPRAKLQGLPHVSAMVNDDELWTTMLLGHSVRIVMGACRGKELLSMVVLVPDGKCFNYLRDVPELGELKLLYHLQKKCTSKRPHHGLHRGHLMSSCNLSATSLLGSRTLSSKCSSN